MKNKKTTIIGVIIGITIIISIIFITSTKIELTDIEKEMRELQSIKVVEKTNEINFGTFESTNNDETALLIRNDIVATIRDTAITKSKGKSTNTEKSTKVGLNSAVVVTFDSTAKLIRTKIITEKDNQHAIYTGGRKSAAILTDTTIETYGKNSSGLVSSNSGLIDATNIILTTKVKESPSIETVDEKSIINVKKSNIETNGSDSPVFKNYGELTLDNTTGTSYGANIGIIKNGTVNISNSTMLASGASNNKNLNHNGIYINSKNSELNITNSSLNINSKLPYYNTATMFIIEDSKTTINFDNTQINFGSQNLLKSKNSEITINCKNQKLEGNIELDSKTKLTIDLKDKSTYTGKINNNSNTSIIISKDSKLVLKSNTHIKELINEDKSNSNIALNGYKLYINNKELK